MRLHDPAGDAERIDFVLEIPSDTSAIDPTVDLLIARARAFEFAGSRLNLNLRVGASEALANAILYGNRADPTKRVRVEVQLDRRRLVLDVHDEGNGFDPDAVPDPRLPENLERTGGRGVFLLRELMDEVVYNPAGNCVRLVLLRERSVHVALEGGRTSTGPPPVPSVETIHRPPITAPLPAAARDVLDDFLGAFPGSWVWRREADGWVGPEGTLGEPDAGAADVPGFPLRVEIAGDDARAAARFLAATLTRAGRHDEELRSFSREIAERYEEITLLYSISEILGSIISLADASRTILTEVASVLGARRASLWVHDSSAGLLVLTAADGGDGQTEPIPIDDPCSLTAAVFREQRPVILAPGEFYRREACAREMGEHGALLSVPVSYTPPEGEARTVGVINLIGHGGNVGFSAGDIKLLSAIASQIGAAVENNRLIAESVHQERMERELELAHDLQLKLLPPLEPFAGYAEVAARCVPADSVGGDFYHLFRLPNGRLGVMIGDVSSHGFGAALIMALTISAVAIHASEGDAPSEVLHRTHRAVIDELENTEMYLTLFYAVIDPSAGTLAYSNAGHAHAFRIGRDGAVDRLGSTDPPFGIVDRDTYGETTVPWRAGEDLLFLFTDGLSDALELGEVEGERALVGEVVRLRDAHPREICDRLFARAGEASTIPPDDRTAVVARI